MVCFFNCKETVERFLANMHNRNHTTSKSPRTAQNTTPPQEHKSHNQPANQPTPQPHPKSTWPQITIRLHLHLYPNHLIQYLCPGSPRTATTPKSSLRPVGISPQVPTKH